MRYILRNARLKSSKSIFPAPDTPMLVKTLSTRESNLSSDNLILFSFLQQMLSYEYT